MPSSTQGIALGFVAVIVVVAVVAIETLPKEETKYNVRRLNTPRGIGLKHNPNFKEFAHEIDDFHGHRTIGGFRDELCAAYDGIDHPNHKGCCPAECGSLCGAENCWESPMGASQCCEGSMQAWCSTDQAAPCWLDITQLAPVFSDTTCKQYSGIDHSRTGACCDPLCGEFCGAAECASGPGGAFKCCPDSMTTTCAIGSDAPCLMPATPPPTTPETETHALATPVPEAVAQTKAPTVKPGSVTYRSAGTHIVAGQIVRLHAEMSGGHPTSCTISPALPDGLKLDATTCEIQGVVSIDQSDLEQKYSITAKNKAGQTTSDFVLSLMASDTTLSITKAATGFPWWIVAVILLICLTGVGYKSLHFVWKQQAEKSDQIKYAQLVTEPMSGPVNGAPVPPGQSSQMQEPVPTAAPAPREAAVSFKPALDSGTQSCSGVESAPLVLQRSWWQEEKAAPEFDVTKSQAAGMPLTRPEPVRVKLTWQTCKGTEDVYATRKPLGLRASKLPITILGESPGHGQDIGIRAGWVLKAINDIDISNKGFYEVDHLFHDEIGKLPDVAPDAGTQSTGIESAPLVAQKSWWQEEKAAPEFDITKSQAADMPLTRAQPVRVKLTWQTSEGSKVVYATRRPLALRASKVPITILGESPGHGHDIGIRAGWVLNAINDVDISNKGFYEVDHLFHDEIGKLPHA